MESGDFFRKSNKLVGGEGKGGLSPGKEFGTGRAEFGRQQPSLGQELHWYRASSASLLIIF